MYFPLLLNIKNYLYTNEQECVIFNGNNFTRLLMIITIAKYHVKKAKEIAVLSPFSSVLFSRRINTNSMFIMFWKRTPLYENAKDLMQW